MKSAAPALAIFLVTAIALAGELQPDPPVKPVAKGDRSRVDWRERITQQLERTQEGVPTRSTETTEQTDAAWLQEVVEVRGGRPALVRVTLERWQRTAGTTTETIAAPRVVHLKPIEGMWEPEVYEPPFPGAARRFIERITDRLAGARSVAAVQSAVLPPSAMAAGATWPVPANNVELLMLNAPYTFIDAAKTRVTARLAAVEPRVQVVLEGTAQLFNAPGTQDRFTEGGVCSINLDATWAPGERPGVGGTVEMRQKFAGATAGQHPDGTPYRMKVALEYELRTSEQPAP